MSKHCKNDKIRYIDIFRQKPQALRWIEMGKGMLKQKRLWFILLTPISLIIILIVRKSSWIAEYIFAQGIYKYIAQLVSSITGLIPISLMELSLYIAVILFVVLLIYIVNLLFFVRKDIKEKFLNILINISCALSVLLFLFTIFAGTNYYRYPFSEINNIEIEESSVEDLYKLNIYLLQQASDLREDLELNQDYVNENGIIEINNVSWVQLTNSVEEGYLNLAEHYPILAGSYGRPKPVLYSKFMSRMEITGVFWPFSLEANINIHAPDHTTPVTIAHEMAHQRGFMREDEANYIAYLACIYSDDLLLQYSGTMLVLSHAGNALYKEDSELYYETRSFFNEGMNADLRYKLNYWSQFDGTVISTASTKMNDTYLKANNQKDGVKSYGRMVDLLLAGFKVEYL